MKLDFEDVQDALNKYNLLPGSFAAQGDEYRARSTGVGEPGGWLAISFASPAGANVEILAHGSEGLFNIHPLLTISVDGAVVARIADTKDLDNAKLRALVEKTLVAFRIWVRQAEDNQLRLTPAEQKVRQNALDKL